MKVLEKSSKAWSREFSCKGCKSLLEAEEEDLKYHVSDAAASSQQYQLDINGEFFVVCPECLTENKLKNIPPIIASKFK